ncbi:unnamed protein product [Aphanomyces euteiches]|uniref:Uncharacterized protein n=1 Tax=Aphanomyces euteiches TaxID=100861 RepID=A0A6G0WEA1_9STRA|nr:hypothetical protein Ae201684_015808 [Aphanomyces euteiches]KAH9099731.1 hypothetical protein Ae201684P_018742 [Aphanomyces euteiches]KAH9153382.1 hypothetical protein AeRB84_004358 [Aphanomyces euteiches]
MSVVSRTIVAGLCAAIMIDAWASDVSFDVHENMRLQEEAPPLVQLKEAFPTSILTSFDPHINLETIEAKYEKIGIHFDDLALLKPHFFSKAIVDHTAKKPKYWRQRYYFNKEYWGGPGFPIFLMIGGEAAIQPSDVSHEMFHMNTLAIEHKALLLSLEHRYYGESYPVPDMSVENMQYLTISQALADIALFHDHIAEEYETPSSKWIAFGGSYPGNLAVWLKQEYPHVVVGSVASSAPVKLVADYKEYMEVVGKDFERGGAECGKSIQNAMQALDDAIVEALKTPGDVESTLYEVLFPCDPLQTEKDAFVLETAVKVHFQTVAQHNDFNPVTVEKTCKYFASVRHERPLAQLAGYLAMIDPHEKCLLSSFEGYRHSMMSLPEYNSTKFNSKYIARQWLYHRCTELGFTQTAASGKSIFSPLQFTSFDLAGLNVCKSTFGDAFGFHNVPKANKWLGGNKPRTQNVTYTNGNMDPWYPLGLIEQEQLPDDTNSIIFIDGTSHCRDMYAPIPNDMKTLRRAHKQIEKDVRRYLS